MPRAKKGAESSEPKKRSRNGCWPCKAKKVKCTEERPACSNCTRVGDECDYSIRLNWDDRRSRVIDGPSEFVSRFVPKGPPSAGPLRFPSPSELLGEQGGGSRSMPGSPLPGQTSPHYVGGNGKRKTMTPPPGSGSGGFLSVNTLNVTSAPTGSLKSPRVTIQALSGPTSPDLTPPPLHPIDDGGVTTPSSQPPDTPGSTAASRPPRKKLKSSRAVAGGGPVDPSLQVVWQGTLLQPGETTAGTSSSTFGPAGSPMTTMATPAASSSLSLSLSSPGADEASGGGRPAGMAGGHHHSASTTSPDIGRLSVASPTASSSGFTVGGGSGLGIGSTASSDEQTTYYGVDMGQIDLDTGFNDDAKAISSPTLGRAQVFRVEEMAGPGMAVPAGVNSAAGLGDFVTRRQRQPSINSGGEDDYFLTEFGFGVQMAEAASSSGGYYDKPVPIRIPKSLEPLPAKLLDNPMNLLYFHHFLNHTARVLVPHDDPQSNPFRTVLPRMAVKNDNLMSLLLAYSASHRARLLQQNEPATRIAHWVQDIFPVLREALNDPSRSISNANLATAVMLASLEIISPQAFGYSIPWQRHLSLARDLIKARPGGLRRMNAGTGSGGVSSMSTPSASGLTPEDDDAVCSFLWSWFAYLDVLGSLSAGPAPSTAALDPFAAPSSSSWILEYAIDEDADADEIDCVMGFTARCVHFLAKVADLARRCDEARRYAIMQPDGGGGGGGPTVDTAGDDDNPPPDSPTSLPWWHPPPSVMRQAATLEAGIRESLAREPRACRHIHALERWDRVAMAATNEAFHWAGLAHLHRRILGKSPKSVEVRQAVTAILGCLERVKVGGATEACLLFPMFTAGCEATEHDQREVLLSRIKSVEGTGMTQVRNARTLMERSWETGRPWETLLSTEFIG